MRRFANARGQRLDRRARLFGLPGARLHDLAPLLGRQHRRRRRLLNVVQDRPHLRGRLPRLLGQTLHFLRDHAKALAVLARPGRFDGGVDREQIRLCRQILHRRDDLSDGLALLAQPPHARRDRVHLLTDPGHAGPGVFGGFAAAVRHLQ